MASFRALLSRPGAQASAFLLDARSGEIKGFTGIDSPYEPPLRPELELRTDEATVEASLARLLQLALGLSKAGVGVHPGDDVGAGI